MPTPYRNLQEEHQRLLEWRETARNSQEFLNAVREYIQRTRNEARWITASRSRNQLRANLRFWAAYLYDHTGAYPDTSLLPPTDAEPGGVDPGGSFAFQVQTEAHQEAARPLVDASLPRMAAAPLEVSTPAVHASPQGVGQPQKHFRLPLLLGGGVLLLMLLLMVFWLISDLPGSGGTLPFGERDTPLSVLPTELEPPVIEVTSTLVETAIPQETATTEPLPTLEVLPTATPLAEATPPENLMPTAFPTPTAAVIVPESDGGHGVEPEDEADVNLFLGQPENAGLSSCRARSITLRFARPAIFEGIALDPALVQLVEAQTGKVMAAARWLMGKSLSMNIPVSPAETTALLQITHPSLTFSAHILVFTADCANNTVQLAFDTQNWQPQQIKSGATGETQTAAPLNWTLLNWGPAPDGKAWVALLQVNAGENAFYWVSGDMFAMQDEPLMDGRVMVTAPICAPARVWIDVTLGGETLRYPLILQAPVCP